MPLESYSKAELKKIVDIYNIGVEESSLKKKKKDLIKDMQGAKKNYNYDEIDKKLEKKVTTTSEPKKKPKLKIKESSEEKKKKILKKYKPLLDKEKDRDKKKALSVKMNKELAESKKK